MYKIHIRIIVLAGLSMLSNIAAAQVTQSPFTSRGIGDIKDLALIHNQAMGGIGISNGDYWYLNNKNPALLPYNSLTTFAAGLLMENRNISNENATETTGGGALGYLATSFPIKPGIWTTSIGLAPYSNVNYSFTISDVQVLNQNPGSDTVTTNIIEAGSGGFSQVYWSNGVALNKHVFIGLRATYIFSSLETEFSNTLQNSGDLISFTPVVRSRTSVSDFLFQGGIALNKDSVINNKLQVKFGATYDFASEVSATKFESTNLTTRTADLTITDTLRNDEGGNISLPWKLGLGLSLNNDQKWMIGVDFSYQPWSEYKNFEGRNEGLEDSYNIGLGGSFTPDPSSVTSYFERVTYRLGFSYENTPYVINGEQVKDFGINFGWSLPVSRFSSLDMAFKYGRRGDVGDTLIEEEYFRFSLGVTFNDRWFIQRKYD